MPRFAAIVLLTLVSAFSVFGQAATGTITGTIADPAGAVVAGANVEVRNSQGGAAFPTVSTSTGNYTVTQLPPGTYEVSVTVPGFKKYVHTNLTVAAAETLRQDVTLEVGAASEAVTVSAEASQLKTESGDINQHITVEQLNDMPVLGIGAANSGSSGVRNPYNSMTLIPGVNYAANFVMVVNGAPSNTAAYRLEGLDNTNHTVSYALQENQPSADAIQEVAIQTSNYAPEFGTAGGGLFNLTMKSGTNGFHGTGYEYFVNEDLNAAFPFTIDANGNKVRPRNRRNDFGGTLGGPIWIPKIYNGKDKTFFFWSYEQYRESNGFNPALTVPTTAYRNGDFSAISPNGGSNFNPNLGVPATALPSTDALGRPIYANTIYDPDTRSVTAAGVPYANPFPNNIIPATRFDPTALKIQALVPLPVNNALVNNGTGYNLLARTTAIPSLKIDQVTGSKGHLSFYWSTTQTDAQFSTPNGNADGLPDLISNARGTFIHSLTVRLNYDYTLTPTVLLHVGAGYSRIWFFDGGPVRNFNCTAILLNGCQASIYFPTVGDMREVGAGAALGGLQQLGNALAHTNSYTERPAYNANTTWVRGNHTYKLGGEVWFQGAIAAPPSGTALYPALCQLTTGPGGCGPLATATLNAGATALPQTGLNLNGWQTGFPYANFLLGDFAQISQKAPTDTRMGKSQWALFIQDSWKVTRKLTMDYGLRWDYATAPHEQYGRAAELGLVPNPAAGGRIGAPIFEATCHCTFINNYPYAIGPRLGVAYTVTPKTVIRGG
ncbi:MAG: carboxypeptidase regulatory-like domain-containing protein, partial [Acidobacteriia bacterium]|nr:carboxypeptidase regulatory-like domain-containing protein [Terriglobia bacterium]